MSYGNSSLPPSLQQQMQQPNRSVASNQPPLIQPQPNSLYSYQQYAGYGAPPNLGGPPPPNLAAQNYGLDPNQQSNSHLSAYSHSSLNKNASAMPGYPPGAGLPPPGSAYGSLQSNAAIRRPTPTNLPSPYQTGGLNTASSRTPIGMSGYNPIQSTAYNAASPYHHPQHHASPYSQLNPSHPSSAAINSQMNQSALDSRYGYYNQSANLNSTPSSLLADQSSSNNSSNNSSSLSFNQSAAAAYAQSRYDQTATQIPPGYHHPSTQSIYDKKTEQQVRSQYPDAFKSK